MRQERRRPCKSTSVVNTDDGSRGVIDVHGWFFGNGDAAVEGNQRKKKKNSSNWNAHKDQFVNIAFQYCCKLHFFLR